MTTSTMIRDISVEHDTGPLVIGTNTFPGLRRLTKLGQMAANPLLKPLRLHNTKFRNVSLCMTCFENGKQKVFVYCIEARKVLDHITEEHNDSIHEAPQTTTSTTAAPNIIVPITQDELITRMQQPHPYTFTYVVHPQTAAGMWMVELFFSSLTHQGTREIWNLGKDYMNKRNNEDAEMTARRILTSKYKLENENAVPLHEFISLYRLLNDEFHKMFETDETFRGLVHRMVHAYTSLNTCNPYPISIRGVCEMLNAIIDAPESDACSDEMKQEARDFHGLLHPFALTFNLRRTAIYAANRILGAGLDMTVYLDHHSNRIETTRITNDTDDSIMECMRMIMENVLNTINLSKWEAIGRFIDPIGKEWRKYPSKLHESYMKRILDGVLPAATRTHRAERANVLAYCTSSFPLVRDTPLDMSTFTEAMEEHPLSQWFERFQFAYPDIVQFMKEAHVIPVDVDIPWDEFANNDGSTTNSTHKKIKISEPSTPTTTTTTTGTSHSFATDDEDDGDEDDGDEDDGDEDDGGEDDGDEDD
jgi:hypothetical protein